MQYLHISSPKRIGASLLFSFALFGFSIASPQAAHAVSFAGADWTVHIVGDVDAPLGLSQAVDEYSYNVPITQSSLSDIVIPVTVPDLISIDVPATVSSTPNGIKIVAHQFISGPIQGTGDYSEMRVKNITAHLEGYATAINEANTSGGFGGRVYEITGCPTGGTTGTSYVNIGSVEGNFLGAWVNMGSATVNVTGWTATRDIGAVPEPGTVIMLLGLAASFAGYGLWKRRG